MTAESDFVVLTRNFDNEPEILLGECKTNGEVDTEQVKHLVTLAKRCTDSGVRAFVMFAKAGSSFSPGELGTIDAHQTTDLNFILLTPQELEPFYPYERSVGRRAGLPHTLEDWAVRSQTLYLKTQPVEILKRHLESSKKVTQLDGEGNRS